MPDAASAVYKLLIAAEEYKWLAAVQVPKANRHVECRFRSAQPPQVFCFSEENIWSEEVDLPLIPVFLVYKVALAPL